MFRKILIANRGEIACRVIATARRLGIRTVAVYSEADAKARHVALADEAVPIGPAPASESYLRGDAIIEAARRTGAEAIHPGYGFLSENPDFVERVEAAGLVFIGPPAAAIRAMGLKDAAKALMERAGVPVVPGYHGPEQGADRLAQEAERIGYPVLIKARAGGGGKGMRLVERPEDFAEALAAAQREARSAFGDPACLIEKYITRPRHIEIQVFADAAGHVLHLFERDCSLQRRHQKVIEEAPAPDMPPRVREAMGRAAVEAARAIGYVNAGTVEFIADGSGPLREDGFWFMEMNTRLQVEHPVSEAITGLDFVEWQLRVAAGEPLPFRQEDLTIDGWAFEARLYAEDPAQNFLPAPGLLKALSFPEGARFERGAVRIDSGVATGDRITPFYDPMIAKVIAHGPDRATALARLGEALGRIRIDGTVTNLAFLGALTRHEGFARGQVDTGLIARDLAALTAPPAVSPLAAALAALCASGAFAPPASPDPWDRLRGFRNWAMAEDVVTLGAGGAALTLHLCHLAAGRTRVRLGAETLEITIEDVAGEEVAFLTAGPEGSLRQKARLWRSGPGPGARVTVCLDHAQHDFILADPLAAAEEETASGDEIHAPMPGLVTSLRARAGAKVARGEPLLTLEAMKMEHVMAAPRDGIIAEILVAEGDQVSDGALLLRLEDDNG